MLYHLCRFKAAFSWLETGWAVAMTFIFITFTRLFFRSGSNLNPAEANEKAWSTEKNMVERIGGDWDLSLIPQMAQQHIGVILVFVIEWSSIGSPRTLSAATASGSPRCPSR